MTITIWQNTNFKGDSLIARGDRDTLRGTQLGNNPSSIRMTDEDDAILLCNKRNWNGEVLYLRGENEIDDLGDEDEGGRRGFRNAVTSFRRKPFTVKVNISIVTGDNGALPGSWSSRVEASADIAEIIRLTNTFFKDQHALLDVKMSDLTYRPDEKRFRMSEKDWKSIPGKWKKAKEIDVVFPDTIEGAVGLGSFPWQGKFCLVAAKRATVEEMARTFAHELGHYWGLTHASGGSKAANIMTQSSTGNPIASSRLRDSQIQDIQQVLARNIARQGDRIEA